MKKKKEENITQKHTIWFLVFSLMFIIFSFGTLNVK